jgi:hypothetical protein
MKPNTALFVALWAANLAVGAGAGIALTHRRQAASAPAADRPAPCAARSPAAVHAPASAVDHPALPPLVEGASSWTEPRASSPANARRVGTPTHPTTGDPIPTQPISNASCVSARRTRFLGREPHVPLAAFDGESIQWVSSDCCPSWSVRGARWRAIDEWGQVVGHAATNGGEGYDVTRCYELSLERVDGRVGTGLYASEDGPWQPVASPRALPTERQREGYQRLLARFDGLFLHPQPMASIEGRPVRTTMFFHGTDPAGGSSTFAVSGGRWLTIARLTDVDRGEWKLVHLRSSGPAAGPNAFAIVAVFDLDHDGTPEVIIHTSENDGGWDDTILRSDDHGIRWQIDATSVGGSTA